MDAKNVLTRFLTESGHFNNSNVRPKAFEPKFDAERKRSETSVSRTDGLEPEAIWSIGVMQVEPTRRKPVLARACLPAESVEPNGLQLLDDEPPPRHAVIVGWPEGPEAKSARQSIQQELAKVASLEKRP